MASVDPRIREFNAQAQQALAAVQRANAEARTLGAQIEQDAAAEQRLAGRVGGRAGVAEEGAAGTRVTGGSQTRTKALTDEEAVQARLNKTRAEGTASLDAQAAAYRNAARYGPYAGGRKTFGEYGYGGQRGGGPPVIPPGGKLPPPGGFPQLPVTTGGPPPTQIGSSLDEQGTKLQKARVEADSYRLSVSKLAQEQNLASVAMHRHGALTTEFISAAQRGEVTIRELGYQTASTIGKFGGWLVAGSAVYGAFAAVSKLGKGALEAYSGVNLLSRVVTSGIDAPKLREEFSSLAGEFNLPIETVTQAVYQMGKVFHSQDGALAASRAVLYSVKVGELDVASATRYLIAIVNGFHLPASKMAEVFDQINAAQNRFGISIADVEAGLAKAGGTFHAAGGDFSHLLAIITTAQKATGNTGQVVGTALARAPNFLRKAANQDVLRQFGIAPGEAIDKVIGDAFVVAQKLSGTKLQELAAAIFGPQYGARIGTPLLQQKALYDKVLNKTSPQAAKGSAAQELKTQLGGVDEQISRIGVGFERLGAELASAHAFDAIGGLIKSMNGILAVTLEITQAFNALPDPLKQSLAYMLQIAIAIRVLRRFQLGEAIAGGPTAKPTGARGALANVFDRGSLGEARLFRGGLYEEQKQLEEQRASVTSQISKHAGESDAARKAYLAASERQPLLDAQAAGGSQKAAEAALRNNESVENYRNTMVRNAQVVDDLKVQSAYADERLKQVNESLGKTKRRGFFSVNAALDERARTTGVQYYPTTAERPSTAPAGTGTPGEQLSLQGKGLAQASTVLIPPNAERDLQSAEATVTRNTQTVGRLQSAAGAFGGAANSLLNRVGTLFFGFSIGLLLKSVFDGMAKDLGDQIADVERGAGSAEALKQLAKSSPQESGTKGIFDKNAFADFLTGSGSFHGPIEELLGIGSEKGVGQEIEETEKAAIAAAQDTLRLQTKQRNRGEPVSFRYSVALQKAIKGVTKSNQTKAQKLKELDRLEQENEQSTEATVGGHLDPGKVKAVQQNIDIARANIGTAKDLAAILGKLDPKTVQNYMDDYTQLLEGVNGSFNVHVFKRAAEVYRYQIQALGSSHNPDDLKELKKDQESFYQAISQAVNDEVTKGFALASSPQERIAIARKALGNLRSSLLADPQKALREQQAEVQKAQQKYGAAAEGNQPYSAKYLKGLQTELSAQKAHLKALSKDATDRKKYFELIQKELRQQIFEAVSAIRDSRFDYRSSQTADPLKQVSIELEKINADLAGAIKAYGRNSSQVFGLLQQREQALATQAQDQLSIIQAKGNLKAAGFYSYQTIDKEKAALANLQRQLAFEQGHANRFSPQSIIELEAQVKAAQITLTEDVEREAKELTDAAFGIKIAKAKSGGHDVRSVQLEIQKAKFDLSQAKTPLEKLQAQEQLITLASQKRDAVAQRRLDNINFEADINKISIQQEIQQLEQLLKDYKLSKDMRRQIREQIHGLKKDTGFDLDIGNITLPTAYDIRRAVQGGVQSNPSLNVTNAPNIVIHNYSSDPNVVGQALGRMLGGPTQSAMRSAGVKG